MFGAGVFLIGLSYLDCTQTALAVVLLVLAVTMSGLVSCGYYVNHMDIAPQYAGTLMGLSNGISALAGFAPPYFVFAVTQSVSNLHYLIRRLTTLWSSAGVARYGARAPSTYNNFIFSSLWSISGSQQSKYCAVCEISWCRMSTTHSSFDQYCISHKTISYRATAAFGPEIVSTPLLWSVVHRT